MSKYVIQGKLLKITFKFENYSQFMRKSRNLTIFLNFLHAPFIVENNNQFEVAQGSKSDKGCHQFVVGNMQFRTLCFENSKLLNNRSCKININFVFHFVLYLHVFRFYI